MKSSSSGLAKPLIVAVVAFVLFTLGLTYYAARLVASPNSVRTVTQTTSSPVKGL